MDSIEVKSGKLWFLNIASHSSLEMENPCHTALNNEVDNLYKGNWENN
jgi:hypothetical protein